MKYLILKKKTVLPGLIVGVAVLFFCICAILAANTAIPVDGKTESDREGKKVPILMYHSVLKDPARSGKFTIKPVELEKDLDYLTEHGYTTVVMKDLIDFVYDGKELPEKPIVLTFDDGHYNNWYYVLPMLKERNMKAVISVVGQYTEQFSENPDPNPNYAYLSWEELKVASESGYFEIQNHTYDMHKQDSRVGCGKKQGESMTVYQETLREDIMQLQIALKEKAGIVATTFTYPFGNICNDSKGVIKELGFQASLSCYEEISKVEKNDPDSLFVLGRFNRPSGTDTESFMKQRGIE